MGRMTLVEPVMDQAARPASPPVPREMTIPVAGGDLALTLVGCGPPLLLLHGWTLDRRMWRPQGPLARSFRLIIPDRRGFGRSSAPPDLSRERDDLIRIADHLGCDTLTLVGVSQGGAVALDAAIAAPDRVAALVLAGAPLAGVVPGGDAIPRDHYAILARAGAIEQLRAEWHDHPLLRLDREDARHLIAQMVADYAARDLLAPSTLAPFTAEAIAALPMPILALCGTGDTPWRLACARYLAGHARNATLALIEAGHLPSLERPDQFNAHLRAFLGPP